MRQDKKTSRKHSVQVQHKTRGDGMFRHLSFFMMLLLTCDAMVGCHWVWVSLFAKGEILLVGVPVKDLCQMDL